MGSGEEHRFDAHKKLLIGLIISSSSLCVIILICLGFWVYCRKKSLKPIRNSDAESGTSSSFSKFMRRLSSIKTQRRTSINKGYVQDFDSKSLEKATGGFKDSNVIGHGGFGCVYSASLDNNTKAAVKKIENVTQEAKREFQNEVELLSKIQHSNIITLLGSASEINSSFIVLELMEKGSLDDQLHEALISLLKGAEEEQRITGLRIARASPRVSHLLFADDSLFFCKAETAQCTEILNIINTYGKASGQLLNPAKSSIMFGNKVDMGRKRDIKITLGISLEGGMGMYLGLPEQICGSKMKVFSFVQDRLNYHVSTWSACLLSKGGKEVQIKSVAQAVPTYTMSCFLLPQGLTDKLRSSVSRYWWSSGRKNDGIHWIAWDKLCLPHDLGGLGFRDWHDFNIALLAKQLWRLLQFPSSLLARVLKGRYFNRSDPLEDRKVYSPSYGWRSLMAAKPLLKMGLRRTIGSGLNTLVWSDPWIPDVSARPARPSTQVTICNPQMTVRPFISQETKEWNYPLLRGFFHPDDIPLILGLRPSKRANMDGYAWNHTTNGVYTVKSGYDLIRNHNTRPLIEEVGEPSTTVLKKQVWKIRTAPKLQHFMWQALSGCVPTCERLTYRHLATDRTCPRCGSTEESINHLLFECPPALQVWALSDFPSIPGNFPSSSIYRNMDFLFWRTRELGLTELQSSTYPWILWFIWKARNDKIFNGKEISPMTTLQLASLEAESWRLARDEDNEEESEETQESQEPVVPLIDTQTLICQVDASWIDNGFISGLGWCYKDCMGREVSGLQGCRRSLSALHAELDSLLWAASCLHEKGLLRVHFETDCSSLVKMIDDPEDWPLFLSELDILLSLKQSFEFFDLRFIPRTQNFRADCLATEARARGVLFSHISQTVSTEGTSRSSLPAD